jgi:putative endonuclease
LKILKYGAVAQLGERLVRNQQVRGSIPLSSTMYYVYVLESLKDGKYYIGVTKDVDRRLKEHNCGYSKSTSPRRPFRLVHSEQFSGIKEAYSRERFLKSKKSKNLIEKIVKGL